MPKYEIGKSYLFVHATSDIKTSNENHDFKMKTPSSQMAGIDITYFRNVGTAVEREFTSIEFLELTCTEIRESKCAWGSNEKYKGYIFEDSEKNVFAIQYPTASYGQTSDKGDYIASRYDVEKEKEDLDILEKSGYLNQYMLFSYLLSDLERAIKETIPSDKRIVIVDYYKDYMGQLETHEPVPDSQITIDVLDSLTKTMNYYLSNMPEDWVVKFLVENMTAQSKKHRYLFTDIIVEKGSILRQGM